MANSTPQDLRAGKKLRSLKHWLSCLAVFTLATANASAILIDFESYTPGDLHGQPASGTQWESKSTNALVVADGIGVGGSKGLTHDKSVAVGARYRFSPSADDLGDVFSSDSILKVSFDVAMVDTLSGNSISVGRFYFGVTPEGAPEVLSLDWYANGKIGFNSGGVFKFAKAANGQDFISTPGVFYTVEAIIDYGAKTYALTVNGVEQVDGEGSSALAFRVPGGPGTGHVPVLDIQYINGANSDFRAWGLDNIKIAAIPEPGTLGMAALGILFAVGVTYGRFPRRN